MLEETRMKRRNKKKSLMKSWRNKLIFMFLIYFAGFATAVYCLAPVPKNRADRNCGRSFACSALRSDEFARSFNEGLHKCINFGKSAALRTADLIKQAYNQGESQVDS